MPAGERGEVGHDRIDGVARGDHDQPPGGAQLLLRLPYAGRELEIAQRGVAGDQCGTVAESAEVTQRTGVQQRGSGFQVDHWSIVFG